MLWERHQAEEFSKARVNPFADESERSRAELVLEMVGSGNKVLDVGANAGDISYAIHEGQNTVVAFDLPEVVKRWNDKGWMDDSILWVAGNAEDPLPFADGEFDVVVAAEVVEHLVNVDGFLKEAFRVLNPGGKIVVSTPNVARPVNALNLLVGNNAHGIYYEDNPALHVHFFTVQTLAKKLSRAGFGPKFYAAGAVTGAEGWGPEGMITDHEREVLSGIMRRFRRIDAEYASVIVMSAEKGE